MTPPMSISAIAKSAACPRLLAATMDAQEPKIRGSGPRSVRERNQDSMEEALLGRTFEQIIQYLLVDSGDVQNDATIIQEVMNPKNLESITPLGSLMFPFELSDFDGRELQFPFSRQTLNSLRRDVKKFKKWYHEIDRTYKWFSEVSISGTRRSDTLNSNHSLHGRIDLLGISDDSILLIELKRTKHPKEDANLQAGLYRDLLIQADSRVYQKHADGTRDFISLPEVEVVAFVYHAVHQKIDSWSTDQIDDRILSGREPDSHAIPNAYLCSNCRLGPRCDDRMLHGRRLS